MRVSKTLSMAIKDLRNDGNTDDMINVATSYVQDITEEQKEVRDKYREYLKEHEEVATFIMSSV